MSSIKARQWAIISAPTIAGILAIVATLADPVPKAKGAELIRAYAANPDRVQVKSVSYHFAYALWLVVVFPLAGLVRRRGAWTANIAGVFAFLAISTIPGFLVVDLVDSAMGREVGVPAAVRIGETVERSWALPVMATPGGIGLLIALPLAAAAAWRAGLLEWWGAGAAVAGIVAFAAFGATLPGNVLLSVAFGVLSVALARMYSRVPAGSPEP